jgi:hypothetical protein
MGYECGLSDPDKFLMVAGTDTKMIGRHRILRLLILILKKNLIDVLGRRSCNGRHIEGSSVGVVFYGENGSMFLDGGDSYTIHDLKNKVVKDVKPSTKSDALNVSNPSDFLDGLHVQQFFLKASMGNPCFIQILFQGIRARY